MNLGAVGRREVRLGGETFHCVGSALFSTQTPSEDHPADFTFRNSDFN